MKNVLLILSFIACCVSAQEIKVKEISKFIPDRAGEYTVSGISPNGKHLLVTGPGSKGLYLIDIKRKKTSTITESAGAGYEPVFSAEGRYICYRSDEYPDNKRVSSLQKVDLITGDTRTLEKRVRNLTVPAVAGNSIVYLADGDQRIKRFNGMIPKSSKEETYVMLEDLAPVICINGIKRTLKPGGKGSYIWVSLSPDKTKLLYCLVGKGTFVSDLNGNVLASAGKLNAPRWIDNQIVAGMVDEDDGMKVISSEIVAFSVTAKKKINLTSTVERHEMYPYPFPDGKRIAFSTSDGMLYIMKIKVRQ
ncbi:MAG: PD40 domain-containing protein [Bacteroidales bacterium]|nr:PD40 domain-containing protein [Bacteroidales bacterium]